MGEQLKKGSSLTKFLYFHLAPKEFKNKMRKNLYLDLESFKTSCKNLYDRQQKHGKVEANNFNHFSTPCKNFKGTTVCPTHQKWKERAYTCDWPQVCEMAGIIDPYEPKNLPLFSTN